MSLTESNSDPVPQLRPHQFQKGASGNPGGKTKAEFEFRAICRTHSPKAVETLVSVMQSSKAMASARVQAAKVLLSYAWGAPKDDQGEGADNRLIVNILQMATQGQDVPTVNVRQLADG